MTSSGPELLIIEDDIALQTVLARQLGEAGYQVHVASDGEAGLEVTRALRPDLVLCDWMMPGLDGLEYCRTIKADPELKSTYVTLLTARSGGEHRVAGLDAGADDFLNKPISGEELLARVRSGLRVRQLQRELADAEHRTALIEMAATLGHEINNPLTGLFGHLELMLQYLENGDRAKMLHHIREAGEIASRIAEVTQRLITLRDPRTVPYLGHTRMIDLHRA